MAVGIHVTPSGELRCNTPNAFMIGCNFKPSTNGVADKAELALATLGTTHEWDTVVQAKTAGNDGNSITVALTADATLNAKASIDMKNGAGCTNLDTVLEYRTAGTVGNGWKVQVVSAGPTDEESAYEDTTAKILTIAIKTSGTTVADVEALFPTTNFAVKTTGTGATTLTTADICDNKALSGGTAVATVTRVGTAFTFRFKASVATVADLETLIDALAGADDIMDIKTSGTGGTTLLATTAFTATPLAGGGDASDASSLQGVGVLSVSRAGVGLYDIVTKDTFKALIQGWCGPQLATPANLKGQVVSYDASTKKLRVRTVVNNAATDYDSYGANDRLHVIAVLVHGGEY